MDLFWPILIFFLPLTIAQSQIHTQLTREEIKKVFGVNDHLSVPKYDVIYSFETKKHGQNQRLKFDAWNETFYVNLQPNTRLISPDLVSVVRYGLDTKIFDGKLPLESNCHYIGQVISHQNATASLSNCANLRGTIIMDDHFLVFNPLPLRLSHGPLTKKGKRQTPHVIYKREAILGDIVQTHLPQIENNIIIEKEDYGGEFCYVESYSSNFLESNNYTMPTEAQADSPFIFPVMDSLTLEMALFLDSKLWQHFNREFGSVRAEQELIDFSLTLINNVHVLYNQNSIYPKLNIILVRYEIWKEQPERLKTHRHRNGQAQRLLNTFCSYQSDINPGSDRTHSTHWDHGVLLTGYDIYHTTTSVAGVAPVARMCDEQFSCSLVEGLHLGRSFVLAHEMGHSLGMVHDGVQNLCGRNRFLMSAVNGAGKTTWSACSVREYNSFVMSLEKRQKNCLIDDSPGVLDRDHHGDGRLPGQRYTADQQCSFFWGRDYKHEIPTGRTLEDICRILWCGNGGSTISTSHPALEGTWCGDRRWCTNGRCSPWPTDESVAIVNGQWSAWTRIPSATCTECKINGGLRVRKEHRSCDSPAPNNGGKSCVGSSLRGIVCTAPHLTVCAGFTRQSFGDRLCTSFKNDPLSPDRQLNGNTFLHYGSPCKLWCHLHGSDLIRNKANFPDGSPCGTKSYCINGECLSLDCDSEALTTDPEDCPGERADRALAQWSAWGTWAYCSKSCGPGQQKRVRACSKAPNSNCPGSDSETQVCDLGTCALWSLWSPWSSCSHTCGDDSYRTKTRTCSDGDNCDGETTERVKCNLAPCPVPSWSNWSSWGQCSLTCGGGQYSRTRTCSTPNSNDCPGHSHESQSCNTQRCGSWSSWSNWSQCTALCGGGQRNQYRECTNGQDCSGQTFLSQPCNLQPCANWSGWSPWSQCSVSCGIGERRRARRCLNGQNCVGSTAETEQCTEQNCPSQWAEWGTWGECTVTCGTGQRTRERRCINGEFCLVGQPIERSSCNTQPCAIWSSWSVWSQCSVTCDGGVRRRNRGCFGKSQFETCVGPQEETESCSTDLCQSSNQFGAWSFWSECSVSCGGGRQTRNRVCRNNSCFGPLIQSQSCNSHSCSVWSTWQSWSTCSATCNSGTQSRARLCRGQTAHAVLITDSGRTVVNSGGLNIVSNCLGNSQEFRSCDSGIICGQIVPIIEKSAVTTTEHLLKGDHIWTAWASWTQCTVSCGVGVRLRARSCQRGICVGISEENDECFPGTCPGVIYNGVWAVWQLWSKCSASCGGGIRTRNRVCNSGDCTGIGSRTQSQSCNTHSCDKGEWLSWTSWSSCTRPCGGGRQGRRRSCKANDSRQCRGFNKEERPCNAQSCELGQNLISPVALNGDRLPQWSEWSVWSGCSCFTSKRVRRRYCQIFQPIISGFCLGPIIQEQPCSATNCTAIVGKWSIWSMWSDCSVDCGSEGIRVRHRMCSDPYPINRGSYCVQQSFERQPCHTNKQCSGKPVHGIWSDWTTYGPCSSSCGSGYRSKTRYCTNPRPENGGKTCDGADFDLQPCKNRLGCNSEEVTNGGWMSWTSWSQCSATCGFAFRHRSRSCSQPMPNNGGRACVGIAYMTRICTLPNCPNARDGAWTAWGTWSQCDGICGQTTRTRIRNCTNPQPDNGGLPCFGNVSDREACNSKSIQPNCPKSVIDSQLLVSYLKKWELE